MTPNGLVIKSSLRVQRDSEVNPVLPQCPPPHWGSRAQMSLNFVEASHKLVRGLALTRVPQLLRPRPVFQLRCLFKAHVLSTRTHPSKDTALPTHCCRKPALFQISKEQRERYLLQLNDLIIHVFLLSVDKGPRNVTWRKTHKPLKRLSEKLKKFFATP